MTTSAVNAAISDIQIDGGSVDENTSSGTTVGTLTTVGENSPYTYELINGTGDEDNSKFTVDGDELKLNFTPDYESPTDVCYKVDVSPSQASGVYEGSITYKATSDASGYYQ